MGFFGKKKTIIVSSTVYNMAGEEATRPDFLKNSVYGAVMSDGDPYIGETIVRNYLRGPGIGQRNFLKWAIRQDYPGLPTYSVALDKTIDPTILDPYIPTPGSPSGLDLRVQSANLTSGDYEHLVEEYVLEFYPENLDTEYVSAYDQTTNDITIQWFGGGSVTFSAGTFDLDKIYVTANYYHFLPEEVQSLSTGSTTSNDLNEPSNAGYTLDSNVSTGVDQYNMNYDERITVVYTGVPTLPPDTDDTTAESDSENFDGRHRVWSKVTYEGGDGGSEEVINKEHFLHTFEKRNIYTDSTTVSTVVNEDTPAAGQTQTITTYRIGDHLRPIWDWRIDTQDTILEKVIGGSLIYIYELYTGESVLDDLLDQLTVSDAESEYFPFMPIRLNNVSITDPVYDDITGSGLYESTNRAYRRASGGGHRFSKLIDEVEANESIDDIDYAFTHHGVAINVIEPACRAYMYEWFDHISNHQTTSSSYMASYQSTVATYASEVDAMNAWVYAQADSGRPGYGDAKPTSPHLDTLKVTTVRLACEDAQLKNLDMRVSWINITESLHSGAPTNPDTGQPAVKGEIWIEDGTDLSWSIVMGIYPYQYTKNYDVEQVLMYWQTENNSYKKLTIWGLVHNNFVYGGEAVTITAKEGIVDADPSGFIVPLHYPTVKALGIVDATQMATANTWIIFNSYEIVKQRWYETFIGMLIIIIIIIILVVITGGLAAGPSAGILGSNAAVGAAMGLTGTAAIVAGAIVNAIVAIAISKIVTYASTAIFGDKWGAIIAAVINLAITMGTSGVGFDNISELGTASNILKITSAIANGYQGYVQGAVAEIGDKMEKSAEKFNEEMKRINKLLLDLRGTSGLNFDPLQLTDSVKGNDRSTAGGGFVNETLDQFIHRTTMVGSDIVEITLSMVNNYADLSTELPS